MPYMTNRLFEQTKDTYYGISGKRAATSWHTSQSRAVPDRPSSHIHPSKRPIELLFTSTTVIDRALDLQPLTFDRALASCRCQACSLWPRVQQRSATVCTLIWRLRKSSSNRPSLLVNSVVGVLNVVDYFEQCFIVLDVELPVSGQEGQILITFDHSCINVSGGGGR